MFLSTDDVQTLLDSKEEEIDKLLETLNEKNHKIAVLQKELETANQIYRMSEDGGDSSEQTIILLKSQMAEMKHLLEGKVDDLKERLESQIAENKKHESDVLQWKSMAQKELKSRLHLETEKSSLQKEVGELRRQSEILKTRLYDNENEESSSYGKKHKSSPAFGGLNFGGGKANDSYIPPSTSSTSSSTSAFRWGQDSRMTTFKEPLLTNEGEGEEADVSIWTPDRPKPKKGRCCSRCVVQ